MKKGKIFTKGQIALVLMVAALGTAIWLNMRFSSNKFLGEAVYVDQKKDAGSSAAVQTAAKADTDYFTEAIRERKKSREDTQEMIAETLKSEKLTNEDKAAVMAKAKQLADRMEKENNIETLLKAKDFSKAVAVIGDKNINIIVRSDGLTTAQTLQIQDIVTGETDISLGNIKIVAVK